MGRTLLLNFKNYAEVLGEGSVELSRTTERICGDAGIDAIVAPPTPMLALVASKVRIKVYSQAVEVSEAGPTTGSVPAESLRAAGATGTIVNHSERRMAPGEVRKAVQKAKRNGLEVCVCARNAAEAVRARQLEPAYISVEPPGLIGTGVAVSRVKPGLVRGVVSSLRKAGFKGRILCGAGIVGADDVLKAVELGADGVMVSSSVVRAKDWESKVRELADSLT